MPMCKGCGGSFDDSFRFCPYCGRAQPESEVIKVEVSVSSGDKWETCQIRRYTYTFKERGYDNNQGYFWADGIGPNGTFSAGDSPIFSPGSEQGGRQAHTFLVNQLIKNGWESDGSFGEEWWQNKFRRRYGKEYPPSWTTWEICSEINGFLQNTGYFFIQRCPQGNEKEPVKHGKSREFNTGFLYGLFGDAEQREKEQVEQEQILKEFLAELKSQGYKLVLDSENKRLKKVLRSGSNSWYFQILMKEK